MAKNLVIVESPAKAKTIEGFLGKDFTVKSSFGHIRDLPGKDLSVDLENKYEPNYVVPDDKKKIVTELKKLAKSAELIWLASDEDREGEAISWHLAEALGLDPSKTRRIVFNEITKNAILKAIENPRDIDMNLVDAQQARRVLDRIVGYELSPVLWRKVKPSLSAGRVQSVAVRLIVVREREIGEFKPEASFRIQAEFTVDGKKVEAELGTRFKTKQEALDFLNACVDSSFKVHKIEKKPVHKNPSAPFTTSTLQQEASRKLGYSVAQTMTLAQKLYEAGKITYMRTDSVNLSELAVNAAKDEITKRYGAEYSRPKQYTTKSSGAQEAHEAIRPTNLGLDAHDGDSREAKLYDLIWKRTVASQMERAELEKTVAHIDVSGAEHDFKATGEVMKFEGFLKVYIEGTDDNQEDEELSGILPPMSEGDALALVKIFGRERFTHHPPRYTEASLVKKLEELGIGRPSTYAPTISTVQKRGYVEKTEKEGVEREYVVLGLENGQVTDGTATEMTGAERNKLFPTDIGIVVNDFLVDNFEKVMDYGFTADVEQQFDEIAKGQLKWNEMIDEFYHPFHDSVEDTLENSERAKGERLLGEDPETGKPVTARIGRFGPMVQIGHVDDEEKPRFASLRKNQSIQTITFEEAMDLFKLPRELGEHEGEVIKAAIGRYGPYVQQGRIFASLPDEISPMDVTLEQALKLIEERKNAKSNNTIAEFEEEGILVLKGRYGPYIKMGKKNYKIPKDFEPEKLTLEDCKKIIESSKK